MPNPPQLRGTPSATGPTPVFSASAGLTPQMALVNADRTPTVFFFRWLLNSRAAAQTGQTPWLGDIDAAGFNLNNLGGLELDAGEITFPDGSTQTTAALPLTPATAIKLGGVKIGANVSVTADGTISVAAPGGTLIPATPTVLGGVKIGANITVTADGTISVAAPGGGGGAVTSVTASAPLASSGGATPNITITSPLPVANGGSGSAAPSLVAGANVTITGAWPNQTIAAAAGTSAVSSVFGRAGAVVAVAGDYTVGQVTGAVATSRQIIAGAGLTGGGDLTADRTLTVNTAAIAGAIQTPWLQNINAAGFTLQNAGPIGIGTSSPGASLDIMSTNPGGQLRIGTVPTGAPQVHVTAAGLGSPAVVQVWLDDTPTKAIALGMGVAGGGAAPNGDLNISAFATATGWVERMRLTNGGNLGIGTTTPGSMLTVAGTLGVSGASTFTGAVTVNNTLTVNSNATVVGKVSVYGASGQLAIYDQVNAANFWNIYSSADILRVFNYGGSEVFNIVAVGSLVTFNYGVKVSGNLQGSFIDASYLICNAYFNGSQWIYRATGPAALISTDASTVYIQSAAAGTAGAALGWTQNILLNGVSTVLKNALQVSPASSATMDAQLPNGSFYFVLAGTNNALYIRARDFTGVLKQAIITIS